MGVFSCMLSPGKYCVDMCDWCFYVHMLFFLLLQIDDQRRGGYVLCMYSAIVYNQDNLCWICVYYSKFLQLCMRILEDSFIFSQAWNIRKNYAWIWFHFYTSLKQIKTMLEISLHAPNIMTQFDLHVPQASFHSPK